MDLPLIRHAFEFALDAHGDQVRKGVPVPFISHLMAVSSLVLEYGGDTEEGAAALLHDTLEDTKTTVEDLRRQFGDRVAEIVLACTDTLQPCPPTWRGRKERFILCIGNMDPSALLVTAADKLHNSRDVVRTQRAMGDQAFWVFQGEKEGTVWYYGAALAALEAAKIDRPGYFALVDDLRREVAEMRSMAGAEPLGH